VAGAVELATLADGDGVRVGPFDVTTASLPHFVPNLGMRITDGSATLTYSGDAGPDPALVELARDADLLLVEATYPDAVPDEDAGRLCSAVEAAAQGVAAGARRIMLTHLWPGLPPEAFLAAAARTGARDVTVAAPGPAQTIGS
jgi:ribonuclease BN (tRNA processing enzyme)